MKSIITFLFISLFLRGQAIIVDRKSFTANVDAKLGEFPWQVSFNTDEKGHFCSGAIVAPRWIITAGKCLMNTTLESIKIYAGIIDLRQISKNISNNNYYTIENVHPTIHLPNDLSLIRTVENITFNDRIQSAIFLRPYEEIPYNTPVIATGWVELFNNLTFGHPVLQKAVIRVKDTNKCWVHFNKRKDFLFRSSNMCTTHQNGLTGSCSIDVGSLLSTKNGVLIGVLSWANEKRCKYTNEPNIYLEVSKFVNWMSRILNKYND